MAARGSFWERVTHVFRADNGAPGAADDPPAPHLSLPPARPLGHRADTAAPDHLPWWRRRQDRLAQTREVSHRMLELLDTMQAHFHHQDERAAEVAGSLTRVGGILEQLADSQRAQGDCLRNIADQTETAGKHVAQMSEKLGRLPDSLNTQADALRVVARQIEVSQESDTQLMHSLQQFGRAVDTLGSSGTAQVEVLQRLNAAQREQHAALSALIREQGRRFVVVVVAAGVVAVIALAALVVTLLLYVNR